MRLIKSIAGIEGVVTYWLAVLGAVLMGLFANYASARADSVTYRNGYGYHDGSLFWGIITILATLVAFIAVCALIIIAVAEVVIPKISAALENRFVAQREEALMRQAGLEREAQLDSLRTEVRRRLGTDSNKSLADLMPDD